MPITIAVVVLFISALQVELPAEILGTAPANHEEGKKLFTQNCMACHSLNGVIVGPSLLEIAFLYKSKPEGIVAWTIKPGRKRNQMIPMPPMAHISKPKLKDIADYILFVTKAMKIGMDGVSRKKLMPPSGNIQRILMPDSGPASIAVRLSDQMSYCWDAGSCRLRYVWTGGFISHTWGSGFLRHQDGNDRRYSFEKAVLKGLPFYRSGKDFPLRFGGAKVKPKYLGYKIDKNKQPHFLYSVNGHTVVESIMALPEDKGFLRHFKINDNSDSVSFTLKTQKGVTWSSNKGSWDRATLRLTIEEAKEFSISIVKTEEQARK